MTQYQTPTLGRIEIRRLHGSSSYRVTTSGDRLRVMFEGRFFHGMRRAAHLADQSAAFAEYMDGEAQTPIGVDS